MLSDVFILQLDGTIVAPTSAKAWDSGLLQWIEFTKLNGVSIQGNGIINGRGQQWWTYSDIDDDEDDDTVRSHHPSSISSYTNNSKDGSFSHLPWILPAVRCGV